MKKEVNIEDLIGKVVIGINQFDTNDRLELITKDGFLYTFIHDQDCCETVSIEDISGDLNSLLNTPILDAYESSNSGEGDGPEAPRARYNDSWTWTFYRIRTIRDTVCIRWLGESNGYYSEAVTLYKQSISD